MLEPVFYKSFTFNVVIIQYKKDDGGFETSFQMHCNNDYQIKRALKKHQRFALYNHNQFLKQFPKDEWLIFEICQNYKITLNIQIVGIRSISVGQDPFKGKQFIPYKFITSQKYEPNPRQLTLLKTLALIL